MKQSTKKSFVFMGRSMLWSVLLYVVMMLIINWDEVRSGINGKQSITVVSTQQQPGPNAEPIQGTISVHTGIVRSIIVIVRTITGISSHPKGD